MWPTVKGFFLFLTVLLTLNACNGARVTGPQYVESNYFYGRLNEIAAQGVLPMTLIGHPVAGEQISSSAKAIAAGLSRHPGPAFPVVVGKPEGFSGGYSLVVVANPAKNASAHRACSEPDQPRLEPTPGQLSLMAVVCFGKSRMTSTFGRLPAENYDQHESRRLLSTMAFELFPPFDFEFRSSIFDL